MIIAWLVRQNPVSQTEVLLLLLFAFPLAGLGQNGGNYLACRLQIFDIFRILNSTETWPDDTIGTNENKLPYLRLVGPIISKGTQS